MSKQIKPVYQGVLYSVIRRAGNYAVVLSGNFERVQYSGSKLFCKMWLDENDIQQAA